MAKLYHSDVQIARFLAFLVKWVKIQNRKIPLIHGIITITIRLIYNF